ncbi:hypothetical protein CO615_04150 [Lysobacteraceae bacterium NML75-0749]|nr:hypothetical protein CO615_04150 [Xanthomonadaceae bacterium NML75-0749]
MNTPAQPTAIDHAAHALALAKQQEEAAKAARIQAEEALIQLVGAKPEGTTRCETAYFKVTTTGKLTRKLDESAYAALAGDIPDAIRARLIRVKHDLVLSELRHLQNNEPELYARIAPAITVTPAKTAVTVETL